ncbi:MAG: hypothetical protein GY950_09720 [bacterium]|nr:hypothetical protein [bacterium]
MLNNKYLAIVLSVVAVIAVVYQVFFSKDDKKTKPPVRQAAAQVQPAAVPVSPTPTGRPAASGAGNTVDTGGDAAQGAVIDFDSPLLLQRVYETPMEYYPKRPLPREFGGGIFALPPDDTIPDEKPAAKKEIRFRLDAIVIDDGKKGRKRRVAIVNDTILHTGEFIAGARVTSIQKSRVVLKFKEKSIVLSTDSRIKTITLVGGKGDN